MMENKMVILKTFLDSTEANIVKAKLEANGIKVFLENENVVGLNPLGGMELKVFDKDLKKAKEILNQ